MDTTTEQPAPDVAQSPVPTQPTAPTTRTTLREPLRLLLFALGIGFLADTLFRGGSTGIGINAPILVVAFLTCLGFLARREGIAPNRAALALFAAPLMFFAAMLAVRANGSLAFLNVAGCGIITLLLLHFWGHGDPFRAPFGAWLVLPWKAFGGTLATAPSVLKQASGQIAVRDERRERFAAIGRGGLLALPILLVFGMLFANADAVFADRVRETADWLFPAEWETRAGRFAWTTVTAFLVAGGFAYSLTRRETAMPAEKAPISPLGITEASIVLATVAALFAAFLYTQTRYLFGGDAHVQTAPNLTYADYAHHGFTELNVVALLSLALIGGLKATTKQETPRHSRTFALLATALLALTFPLLASAFSRMTAYEAAYGATEMRLYVDVFMAWLAVGLAWCGATLWRPTLPGGIGVYICAVGFLLSLNVLNPDREIARRNVDRYQKTGRIDRAYLRMLSDDALPELVRLHASSALEDQRFVEEINALRHPDPSAGEWGVWNLSRATARSIREAHPPHSSPDVPVSP